METALNENANVQQFDNFYSPTFYLIGEFRRPYTGNNKYLACLETKFTLEIPGSRRVIDFKVLENETSKDGEVKRNPLFDRVKNFKPGSFVFVGFSLNVIFRDDGKVYYNYRVKSIDAISSDFQKQLDRIGVKLIE